jgi:hypothetical protein
VESSMADTTVSTDRREISQQLDISVDDSNNEDDCTSFPGPTLVRDQIVMDQPKKVLRSGRIYSILINFLNTTMHGVFRPLILLPPLQNNKKNSCINKLSIIDSELPDDSQKFDGYCWQYASSNFASLIPYNYKTRKKSSFSSSCPGTLVIKIANDKIMNNKKVYFKEIIVYFY